MYREYYRMSEDPFCDEASVEWFFESQTHGAVLARIMSGSGMPLLVVGASGSGKTTLRRRLAGLLDESPDASYINVVPTPDGSQLLWICLCRDEDGLPSISMDSTSNDAESMARMFEGGIVDPRGADSHINCFGCAGAGDRFLIADDLEGLSAGALAFFESIADGIPGDYGRRIRIVGFAASGFPKKSLPRFEVVDVGPLSLTEVKEYVYFRLFHSSAPGVPLFTEEALEVVYRYGRGNPGATNAICRACLKLGARYGLKMIDGKTAMDALIDGPPSGGKKPDDPVSSRPAPVSADVPAVEMNGDTVPKREKTNSGLKAFIVVACLLLLMMLIGTFINFKDILKGFF
ncbi:MAG: hypothetical protein ACLGPL_07890 [Acidobacteriota bacterium]